MRVGRSSDILQGLITETDTGLSDSWSFPNLRTQLWDSCLMQKLEKMRDSFFLFFGGVVSYETSLCVEL